MALGTFRVRLHAISIIVTLGLVAGMLVVGATAAFAASINSSGPLTRVEVSDTLNCAVDHAGDVSPEFFGDIACGTLLAVDGTLYGPPSIPAGAGANPRTAFTAVSQTAVTGAGTSGDPFTVVTVVALGTSGLQITETDSYVVGEESYRTDVSVMNTTSTAKTATLYRAGDCYLQNSDRGFGSADAGTGAVSCVAGVVDSSGNIVPGTRIEQWFPLSSGGHYYEDVYFNVWAKIGTQQPFADSCAQCSSYVDNGAGLSWDLALPAGGSLTRSHLTVFSPLGLVPLTTSKTADSATASAGGSDGYTITIHNPNTAAVSLTDVTDTLPSGFSYTPGSSSGATTADPSILGQNLAWAGPISVPASGDISIHFNVTVSSIPGDYFNNAGGNATGFTVAPSGDTAKITVTGQFTLTVAKAGSGSGTVSSSPAGIDCGATCATSFANGTMVTLTATPDAGSSFTGWGGDCTGTGPCVVTMDLDRAVTATFDLVPHTLTVAKAGSGSGTVSSSPAGIDCGATCATSFANGTMVTLTATPDAGSSFTGWGGDCTGTGPCVVTMDQDRAVTATFDQVAQPPRVLKEDAVASLQTLLPTGDQQTDRKIQRAINEINDSLEPRLWLDDSHLTDSGRRVFHEEKEAARALTRILNPPTIVASVLDSLVPADRSLARTAIDEATAAGGDAGILAEAEKQMQKAAEELANGHLPEAIEHFGRAWKKAQRSLI
jgi:uncharacterized repeat protein (TIGR01451 family)